VLGQKRQSAKIAYSPALQGIEQLFAQLLALTPGSPNANLYRGNLECIQQNPQWQHS